MKINAAALQTALDILTKVPLRSGIECSEYIRLVAKDGKLALFLSSDMAGEVEVKHDSKESWEFLVERNMLLPFVKQAKKELDITVTEKELVIQDGRRRARFKALGKKVVGYIVVQRKIPGEVEITLTSKQLARMQLALKYATFNSMFPQLNCVYLTKAHTLSSNSYTCFVAKHKKAPFTGPFPLELIPLLKEKGTKVFVHASGARLEFPGGWIFCSIRDRCKTFPEKSVMAQVTAGVDLPVVFRVHIDRLRESVERLANYISSAASIDLKLSFSGTKGEDTLYLACGDRQATFKDRIKLPRSLEGDVKDTVLFNELHLLLKDSSIADCEIELATAPKNWFYFRIPEQDLQVITSRIDTKSRK